MRKGLHGLAAGRAARSAGEVLLLRQPVSGRGGETSSSGASGSGGCAGDSRGPRRDRVGRDGRGVLQGQLRGSRMWRFRLATLLLLSRAAALGQDAASAVIERLTGPSSRLGPDLRVLTDEIGGRV